MKKESPEGDSNKISAETLKAEAKEFFEIASAYRRERFSKDVSETYVMNRKWIHKWKAYVNYTHVKRKMQYSFYGSSAEYEPNYAEFPGEINNDRILVPLKEFLNDGDESNPENQVVKTELDMQRDIRLVNKKIWDFFQTKYGGGPVILKTQIEEKAKYSTYSRKIIEVMYRKINCIILPLRNQITDSTLSKITANTVYISRTKKLDDLKKKVAALFNSNKIYDGVTLEDKYLRLWKLGLNTTPADISNFLTNKKTEILEDSNKLFDMPDLLYLEYIPTVSLEDLELADTDTCIIEISDETTPFLLNVREIEMKEEVCDWCRSRKMCKYFCICREVWYCSEMCKLKDSNYHDGRCVKKKEIQQSAINNPSEYSKKGLVGLQNLGNTCFMNTALQCIMNCYELSNYFLRNIYKDHINEKNPIGTGGVLARAYTNLLKNVYNGTTSTFSPWDFKSAISGFQTMFMGYQQHDTQEFLTYLLDGLHEDLNKVLKKPGVEKDDTPKEDSIKAKEQWIGFLRRNQSILVELMYGQYKSTLYCPQDTCRNVSVTFDPFLSLTLPIQRHSSTYDVRAIWMPYDISVASIMFHLKFNGEQSIMALRNKAAKALKVHPWSFLVFKITGDMQLEQLYHSKMLIRSMTPTQSRLAMMGYGSSVGKDQITYFLAQINPKFFYSMNNKYFKDEFKTLYNITNSGFKETLEENEKLMKELNGEDYEEENSGQSNEELSFYSKRQIQHGMEVRSEYVKVNTDENLGFDNNWIKVILSIQQYDYDVTRRSKINLQRIVYMHKSWTTKRIHHEVFKYIFPILSKRDRLETELDNSSIDYDKYYAKYFGEKFNPTEENDTMEAHQRSKHPYRLRVRSIVNEAKNVNCYHCKSKRCHDCLLSYDEETNLGKLLTLIPANKNGDIEYEIDNNFYYLNLSAQSRIVNKDFMLELTWLREYKDSVYSTFDDMKEIVIQAEERKKQGDVNLDDCFKNFMACEKLGEQNEWYCPSCKSHQRALKKMEIYKAPPILVLHLKRFSSNNKISTFVNYPVKDLDLSHYIINTDDTTSKKYNLFAVSNHYGGMGGGHYVAYAQNYFNKKWYKFDDSHVAEMDTESVVKESGYVLFYKRQDIDQLDLEKLYTKPFEDYEPLFAKTPNTLQAVVTTTEDTEECETKNTTLDSSNEENKKSSS